LLQKALKYIVGILKLEADPGPIKAGVRMCQFASLSN